MGTKGVTGPRPQTAHLPLKHQVAIAENEGIHDFLDKLCRETRGHGISPVVELEYRKLHGPTYGGLWYQWAQRWLHGQQGGGLFLHPLLRRVEDRREDAKFVTHFLQSPAEYRLDPDDVDRLRLWADPAPCGAFFFGKFFNDDGELRGDAELKSLGVELADWLEAETVQGVEFYDGHGFVEFNTVELRSTIDFLNEAAGEGFPPGRELEQTVDAWLRLNISKRERSRTWVVVNEHTADSADDQSTADAESEVVETAEAEDNNVNDEVSPESSSREYSAVDVDTGTVFGNNIMVLADEFLPDSSTTTAETVRAAARAHGTSVSAVFYTEAKR